MPQDLLKLLKLYLQPQGQAPGDMKEATEKKGMCRKPTLPQGPTACSAIKHVLYVTTLRGAICPMLPIPLLCRRTHCLPSTPTYSTESEDGAHQA